MAKTLQSLGITAEKIVQYDQRIPRYTSYPTAPFWTEDFGPNEWRNHLRNTNDSDLPLSLYVHIPFCEKHCRFCACNTIITPKKELANDYLDYLEREIELVREAFPDRSRKVIQLNLGGGTPNYLTQEQMSRLMGMLEKHFDFAENSERSIEVDPRVATPDDIRAFHKDHGFSRISFGVQDFNPATQAAIGREQTKDITFKNVEAAREVGFRSVNIDLIYGLPQQTQETWDDTVENIIKLRPDRLALYNFAYLPSKLPNQRSLTPDELPEPELKLKMFIETHNRLTQAGWDFIGMDHYALHDDSLAVAQRNGSLRRNFMGYTTWRGTDILAFGISAISDFQSCFVQNVKKLTVWKRMIDEGKIPVERGLLLSDDDRARQFMIEEIMCNGILPFDADTGVPSFDVGEAVKVERERLRPLEEDGLMTLDDDALRVTEKGHMFLRNIAVVFDAYLKQREEKPLFSRAV